MAPTPMSVLLGRNHPSFERYGVQYYPSLQEISKHGAHPYAISGDRAKSGADVYLTLHPFL